MTPFLWNGRLDASIAPYATRDFTPRLAFEQNFFRYTRFSRLNFDHVSISASLAFVDNYSNAGGRSDKVFRRASIIRRRE